MREPAVFTRLYLPRPLGTVTLTDLVSRLMGSDVPRPLSLEVQASPGGIAHFMGCAPTAVARLKRLLRGYVPGIRYEAAIRADVATVSRLSARPGGLPLAATDPEQVVAAVFQALAGRRSEEHVALQLVLGRSHRPKLVTVTPVDPLQPLASRLLDGVRPAPADIRRRLQDHAAQCVLEGTLRIGVRAETPKRNRALTWELFGALEQLESPGVRLSLVRDTIGHWQQATGAGNRLRLSATDLVPLLSWPLGDRDYPGIPSVHPRLLPVPEIVSRTDAVFATGTAPGPKRLIGIDPVSRMQHLVVTGPTGSGKSRVLEHFILSDIAAKRACVVIEPKRQLIDRILNSVSAEAAGQIVIIDAADSPTVGFNPFDIGNRDPYVAADSILAALKAIFEDGWGPRTEYLIQGALTTLLIAGVERGKPYTVIDLPRIFTDPSVRRTATGHVAADPALAAFWAEFEELSPGQRANQIAAPLNKLRKLVMRKNLVAVLGQSRPRFRLRDVFRTGMTVLVPLNEALIGSGAATLLGSLIVAELFMAAQERASEKDPIRRPGMVFIDEVQNYLHLPTSIDNALGVFRSYGVGLHVAHQHRAQLPAAMRAAFDSNARSKICFALQAGDAGEMAKLAPGLSREDFQGLGPREIYTHLVAGGVPVGWCSARTLDSPPETGSRQQIIDESRYCYGAQPAADEPARTAIGQSSTRPSHQKAKRP